MLSACQTKKKDYIQTLNRMGWSMLFFDILFFGLTFLTEGIILLFESNTTSIQGTFAIVLDGILSTLGYMIPFFAAGIFFLFLSRHNRTERICLEAGFTSDFPLLILAGLAINTAGSFINSIFCDLIGFSFPEDMVISGPYDNPSTIILYMASAIAPAFAEEFLFRGVFYTNLRPYGRTQAILISSLLFALMHQNIAQLFYTFVAGIAMALMYELTGSIWCSVIYHLINNELAVLFEVMIYGKVGENAYTAMIVWDIVIFVLGITALIILIFFPHKKKPSSVHTNRENREVFRRLLSTDRTTPTATVVRGLLTPGIITFTAATVFFMLLTWASLLIS